MQCQLGWLRPPPKACRYLMNRRLCEQSLPRTILVRIILVRSNVVRINQASLLLRKAGQLLQPRIRPIAHRQKLGIK